MDQNSRNTLIALSSVDGVSIVALYADPVTHRLLVDTAGGAGTVTSVAALTIGTTGTDLSSTVANSTTTPVITLNVPTASATNRGALSSADWSTFNAKQTALGFTPEDVANKSTNTALGTSDTLYPSQNAVKTYVDNNVAGLLDYRGGYDASGNVWPSTGGSGTAGAVLKGDMWVISVAGTLGGNAVAVGDSIIANVDTPGQTAANWNTLNTNITYVPENVANKVTSISGASTDTQYPSAKLTYDQLALKLGLAGGSMSGAINEASGTNIASATTTDIGAATGNYVNITGTTTITDFGTVQAGTRRIVNFNGSLILTYNATSLILPTSANITTVAGDTATFVSLGSGNWVCVSYQRRDGTALSASAGGSSFWTALAGATRVSNTTFTVTGDQTAILAKGVIIKWTESSTVRVGMVSIPSTYGATTTVTIIGDTMTSIDSNSLKYCLIGAEPFQKNFAVAGTIGATGTNIANTYYATEPMRVIGADLQVGTAGTTNSTTIDINKNGTTMFTTKPTLATTVATSATPFTADSAISLVLADRVSLDIDAIQTTAAIDLYAQLYLFPTRYLNMV